MSEELNPYGLTGEDLIESLEFLVQVFRALAPQIKERQKCRHCQSNLVNRPRGLCWSCYYKPGVRDLYPSTSKYARRGVGNVTGLQPLPSFATNAMPGTEEKLAIMAARAELKQQLFHPEDMSVAPSTMLNTLANLD